MANNTFEGTQLKFSNQTIHFILAEVVKFRKQLTVRSEFRQQSGWDDALNKYIMDGLEQLRDTIENIVYNPSEKSLEELGTDIADTSGSLAQDYADGRYSIHSDNIVMATSIERPIDWDLTGNDVDIPQPTKTNYPNDFGRGLIVGLDNLFVELTRLDSRFQGLGITKTEGVRMGAMLNHLYTITQRKGGEANKSDIPTGTLPSDDVDTFKG